MLVHVNLQAWSCKGMHAMRVLLLVLSLCVANGGACAVALVHVQVATLPATWHRPVCMPRCSAHQVVVRVRPVLPHELSYDTSVSCLPDGDKVQVRAACRIWAGVLKQACMARNVCGKQGNVFVS